MMSLRCALLAFVMMASVMALHYWRHPEAPPHHTMQQLQQLSRQGWVRSQLFAAAAGVQLGAPSSMGAAGPALHASNARQP